MLLASGGHNPRFAPDGRWIAYWAGRGEGSITPGSSGVFIVEAGGGQPRAIHPEMGFAFYPSWSPKSDRLLVRGWKGSIKDYDFWILPVDTGDAKRTDAVSKLSLQGLGAVKQGLDAPEWIDGRALFAAPLADSANLWEMDLTAEGIFSGPARRVTRGPGRQAHPAW